MITKYYITNGKNLKKEGTNSKRVRKIKNNMSK